jgi:hypothetical protein
MLLFLLFGAVPAGDPVNPGDATPLVLPASQPDAADNPAPTPPRPAPPVQKRATVDEHPVSPDDRCVRRGYPARGSLWPPRGTNWRAVMSLSL